MQTSQPTPLILVVQSNRMFARQILAKVREVYPTAKFANATDLSEAYNLSEHAHPDLVILDQDHAAFSGLSMFFSLLSALAIGWVMVRRQAPVRNVPAEKQVTLDGLARYIVQEWWFQLDRPQTTQSVPVASRTFRNKTDWKVVVIGASTGGIEALIDVLTGFPEHAPPTLIVQHINASFLPGLAHRLDRLCKAEVRAARSSDVLKPGRVLLAPGHAEHLVITDQGRRSRLDVGPPHHGHRPSVDALFSSAARHLGPRCVGVLLSGMGCDGAAGLLRIRKAGGSTIAQDEATCAVYGMPRKAAQIGAVNQLLPLPLICDAVLKASSVSRQNTQDA